MGIGTVSYTHIDVYKRQVEESPAKTKQNSPTHLMPLSSADTYLIYDFLESVERGSPAVGICIIEYANHVFSCSRKKTDMAR